MTDTQLFNALLASVRPLILAAAEASSLPARTTVVIVPSTMTVDVCHRRVNGELETVLRQPGDSAIAEAVGALVAAGLDQLPPATSRHVSRILEAEAGGLVVLLEVDEGTIGVALMPTDHENIAVVNSLVMLFAVTSDVTVH